MEATAFLSRLKARDPEALSTVVALHARRLYRVARGLGCQASEAEDVAQEVFVTFLETLDRFEGRSEVSTWLIGILHHKVRERRRAVARDERHHSIEDVFESQFDAAGHWTKAASPADRRLEGLESAEAVTACLAELPDRLRDVFHLRQVEELSAAEVGVTLDCTPTHVGVLLHRARLRLRACLERKGWRPGR
ncbi:MAG: RNA polymerase sigma factor [Vicinamibacterales bacterium]|nr:RNA polymerase sigma factor [Vicinamibacterales bacterium]